MSKTYKFHSDPGHGWLAVKLKDIEALGVKDISGFSYKRGDTAYLEEDCDAGRFIDAYKLKYNTEPAIKDLRSSNRPSPIRNYERFITCNY